MEQITKRIRELVADMSWVEIIDHMQTNSGAIVDGDWLDAWQEAMGHACDAVDAIHGGLERERFARTAEYAHARGFDEGWASADDWLAQNEDAMAEHGWVRLPLDADGVPIHIGDVMDGYGKTIEVVEMRYGRGGWALISRDGNGYADTFAFTHHHAPTVEDVLEELLREYDRDDSELTDGEIIEMFAKRLTLAEGEDA